MITLSRRAVLLTLALFPLALSAYAAPSVKSPVVKMVTTKGTILIKLFPREAPISSANFEKLVRKGFYNGLTFHRIADLEGPGLGHIVQGGQGRGGAGVATIKGEFPSNGVQNPLKHVAGAVAMARTNEPNSADSQFYFVVTPAPHLDGDYAVFGQVIKGMDVTKKLVQGDKMLKVTMAK